MNSEVSKIAAQCELLAIGRVPCIANLAQFRESKFSMCKSLYHCDILLNSLQRPPKIVRTFNLRQYTKDV